MKTIDDFKRKIKNQQNALGNLEKHLKKQKKETDKRIGYFQRELNEKDNIIKDLEFEIERLAKKFNF